VVCLQAHSLSRTLQTGRRVCGVLRRMQRSMTRSSFPKAYGESAGIQSAFYLGYFTEMVLKPLSSYLGEVGIWTGIWALSVSALRTPFFPKGTVALAAASPLFTYLIIRNVS
jgi:hypothetical protein